MRKMLLKDSKKGAELLLHYQSSGDKTSLEAFYKHAYKPLLGRIRRYVQDYDDANDILQNTFIKLQQNNIRYNPALSSPEYWLFWNISYSLIRHFFRDKKIHEERYMQQSSLSADGSDFADFQPLDGDDPHKTLIRNDKFRLLHNAIFSLDNKLHYQDIIILHHFGNIGLKELAGLINHKYATVRTWHDRAKEQLFQFLSNHLTSIRD